MNLDSAPPRGTTDLHYALQRLTEVLKPSRFQKPDPVKQLLDVQRVSPMQIARIYGWKTEDGDPDTEKVFQEAEKPGTHYNPETWVHPAMSAVVAEVNEQWKLREPRVPRFQSVETVPSNDPKELDTGSLDQYLADGATIAQICRYFKVDEGFLEMYAEDKGFKQVGDIYISKEQIEKDAQAKEFQEATK